MKIKRITDRELDIMNVFWKSGEPMIASEIVAKSPELSISTVQISLKKLMEKGYLQVADIVYSGKVLTRRYETIRTTNSYIIDEIDTVAEGFKDNKFSVELFETLLNLNSDEKGTLDKLEALVKKRKEEIA